MSRRKGSVLSEEHKKKLQEGRAKAKLARSQEYQEPVAKVVSMDKPYVRITGKEKDAFDFFEPLRDSLRPQHEYMLCKRLEREITNPSIWQNIKMIISIIDSYCKVTSDKISKPKKVVKPRKPRAPLTEEQKARLRANLVIARSYKGK